MDLVSKNVFEKWTWFQKNVGGVVGGGVGGVVGYISKLCRQKAYMHWPV